MEAIDTRQCKGYTIEVYLDDSPDDPRNWDNLGTMVCFHRNYDLGDKHSLSVDDVKSLIKRQDIVYLPLYLYDHSGIWMSTDRRYPFNCPWDSGQVGIIYVDKARIRQEYSCKRITKSTLNKAISVLVGEVDTYSKYISGEVFGYNILYPDGRLADSCWGYYDIEEMVRECESIVDDLKIEEDQDIAEIHLEESGELALT